MSQTQPRIDRNAKEGRLLARPTQPTATITAGIHAFGIAGKAALLYVPIGYQATRPAPLAVLCHGAGGNAGHGLYLLQSLADEVGLLILAPASQRQTWDIIMGDYGPDVAMIDEALAATFARCLVDPERVAIGGFSDGASYALSVGVMNGDLFRYILAFSPGFMAPLIQRDLPKIFISHGITDRVLPIDCCSRQIAPRLMEVGYEVRYQEFDGSHSVPPAIAREAVEWFLK